jgi:hypothetical protein
LFSVQAQQPSERVLLRGRSSTRVHCTMHA